MSKKHYERIAAIFKAARDSAAAMLQRTAGIDSLAGDMASYFAEDNPRFDTRQFLKAAGVDA